MSRVDSTPLSSIFERRGERARRRGLTLIELLIALSILSMIATVVGGMLSATAYGTDAERDVRQLVARSKMVTQRVNAAVRGSGTVLQAGSDAAGSWVVLWHRDLDGNDEPSLLEIRRLDFDTAAQTFSSYTAADGAPDVLYTKADDFETITDNLRGTDDFPQQVWAHGVAAFSFSLDSSDEQLAQVFSYRLSLTAGGLTDISIGAVTLRN